MPVDPHSPVTPRRRGLAGRGMAVRTGPILDLFGARYLDGIAYPAEAAARVKELATRGVVVYVHRARNPVEHLALARAVVRLGLPQPAFVGGLDTGFLQPWWRGLLRLTRGPRAFSHPPEREEALLRSCVGLGLAAEIFLRRPLTLLSTTTELRARYVEALVRLQRTLDRPIFLVPHFLALRQRPKAFEPTALDAVFGSVDEPGLLRGLTRVIAARGQARFEVSEAVDLQKFLAEHPDKPGQGDDVAAKKVRWVMLHHLARVERVAHGPAMKSAARMRDDVLKDPNLARFLDATVQETGLPRSVLEKRAKKLHDEIAARFDVDVARTLDKILNAIWSRIYEGIIVEDEALERVREAAKRGPLVIVPSHRSHIDYLVLSQVMMRGGMLPPLVAAGDNLSFFPLGPLFRKGGAYFLRRSFKGDPLYAAVFRTYVGRLFKEGFTQEFFIEGGRSRTGKTLPPKLGILSMLVDAFLESREQDALFVPCHITYERIVEAKSYQRELSGADKEKESAAALVKSASVLSRRYGRVFVTFDEPISLAAHLQARGVARDAPEPEAKRAAVHTLGQRIVFGINRAAMVTSTSLVATALFGFRRKGLDEPLLLTGIRQLVQHLDRLVARGEPKVRFEPGLRDGDDAHLDDVVRGALGRLVREGLVVRALADDRVLYRIGDGAVVDLDFWKNHVLHFFVPEAIVATALSACGGKPGVKVPRRDVAKTARELSRVLKLELHFKVGVGFDELFQDAVHGAVETGFVDEEGTDLVAGGDEAARLSRAFARNLIANFVEGYAACLRLLPAATERPAQANKKNKAAADKNGHKALVLALLEGLQGQLLAGDIVCAETPSKALVENAVSLCVERGILAADSATLLPSGESARAEILALLDRARPRR